MSIADQIKGHSCGLEEYKLGEIRYWRLKFPEQAKHLKGHPVILKDAPFAGEGSGFAYASESDAQKAIEIIGLVGATTHEASKEELDEVAKSTNKTIVYIMEFCVGLPIEVFRCIDWWTVKP